MGRPKMVNSKWSIVNEDSLESRTYGAAVHSANGDQRSML
jgi:hypothetical protein